MRLTAAALALMCSCLTPSAFAEQKPKWEAGVGLSLLNFPDYRGANQRTTYLLPFPYFVYRGDVLKVDGQKIRGLFFKSESIQLDVSLSGSIPVNSSDNDARRGMPDLDPTFEFGPSLIWNMHRTKDDTTELDLRVPLRAVWRSDLSYLKFTGWVFNPHLNIDVRDKIAGPGWNFGVSTGPVISDRKYHQYFYNVDSRFATADRPAYSAGGGYSGWRTIFAVSKRYPRFWLGGFVRWDNLNSVAFESSPLVKNRNDLAAGFAVSWIFAESKTLVDTTH
jgi:MipA family protein